MDAISIGRAPDNDLVLSSEKVSRYHARVYYRSGRWVLVDLQSTHGTSVNGAKLDGPVKLRPADVLHLSDVKLVYDGTSILSAEGKTLVTLVDPSSSAPYPQGGYSAKQKPVQSGSYSSKSNSFGLLVVAALAGIFIIFGTSFIILTVNNAERAAETEIASEPEAVIEYGTIPYDGGEYTGWLKDGLPHGQGSIRYPVDRSSSSFYGVLVGRRISDRVYEGEWKNGLKHGYGTITNPDGTVREGYWENDTFIGPQAR